MQQTISIVVTGKVQGVFYRQSTKETAVSLGITGTVHNLADGSVKVIASGTKAQLDKLIAWCHSGPAKAIVANVETQEEPLQTFFGFKILR